MIPSWGSFLRGGFGALVGLAVLGLTILIWAVILQVATDDFRHPGTHDLPATTRLVTDPDGQVCAPRNVTTDGFCILP